MSLLSSSDLSELRNWSPSTGQGVLRRRRVAGHDVKSSVESCVNDVGDVLVVELEKPVDNPETTIVLRTYPRGFVMSRINLNC